MLAFGGGQAAVAIRQTGLTRHDQPAPVDPCPGRGEHRMRERVIMTRTAHLLRASVVAVLCVACVVALDAAPASAIATRSFYIRNFTRYDS
jgi:hypothetical protein